jgi:hypothetical protein
MPPIGPPPADEQRGTVGHAIGRALDYIGYGTFGLLALAPLLALAWVCVRLLGDSSDGALRLFAGIASALAVLSGWILYRVTEGNLRSIRNAWKPPALTWRQFELSQRLLYSAAIMIMLVGAAGIGVAIPTHL